MEALFRYIDQHFDESLQSVIDLVAIPSFQENPEGIRKGAEYIAKLFQEKIGAQATIYETPGNPIIVANLPSPYPHAKTMLIYGHYDVVPGVTPGGELSLWKIKDPFRAEVIDGRLYGRGTADNKAQFFTHIAAIMALQALHRPIPIHVKFLIEGEEEGGNANLSGFVSSHRDILAADFVYTSDGSMHESGAPQINFGGRGAFMTRLRLKLSEQNHHSGRRGGVVPNAAQQIINLWNQFFDADGNVALEGFYDNIIPPSEHDLELIDALPYDPELLAKSYGLTEMPFSKRDYYLNTMFRPTFELNYFHSGSLGSIPGSAEIGMDMRFVADQDPDKLVAAFKRFVAEKAPAVEVIPLGVGYPSRTDSTLPICRHIVDVMRQAFQMEPICIPIVGFSCPDYVWTKVLGVPSITVPYANSDSFNHCPNENIKVECFRKGIRATAQLLSSFQYDQN